MNECVFTIWHLPCIKYYTVYGIHSGYMDEGFLSLQHGMDLAIVKTLNRSATVEDITVQLRRMPFPPYSYDRFSELLPIVLVFIIIACFCFPTPNMVKDIVLEKERMLKVSYLSGFITCRN